VQLGLTDDSFTLDFPEGMTWQSLTDSFLPPGDGDVQTRLKNYLNVSSQSMDLLHWLGIFEKMEIGVTSGSPAQVLQRLIEQRWVLEENDKDMIVMWHRFRYKRNGSDIELQSKLIAFGDDPVHTAMSKTVGLPIAIAAKHILLGNWKLSGVHLPTIPSIYEPVLDELSTLGIHFSETETHS
jgi:saccharopine dehydrogenase (NADP+, L-glutamate forming)